MRYSSAAKQRACKEKQQSTGAQPRIRITATLRFGSEEHSAWIAWSQTGLMGLTRWVCAFRNRDAALQSAFQKVAWFEKENSCNLPTLGDVGVLEVRWFPVNHHVLVSSVSSATPRIFGNPTHPFSPLLPCFPSSREYTQDSLYAIPELAPLLRYVIALPARRSRAGGIVMSVICVSASRAVDTGTSTA